jgi:hypothetical protein
MRTNRKIPPFIFFAFLILFVCSVHSAENDDLFCLDCHSESGHAADVPAADYLTIRESAHKDLACTACHQNADTVPHESELKTVDCLSCHQGTEDASGRLVGHYGDSVHGRARDSQGGGDAATCVDCHGKHDIRGPEDPESMIYRLNIPLTCARCHEDNQVVLRHSIHAEKPYMEYERSAHGKALYKDGLIQVAAVCTDCHGIHDIEAASDSLPMASLPETCGKCHVTVLYTYDESIHGRMRAAGDTSSPVCIDCHGEHGISTPEQLDSPTSKANIPKTCASCHANTEMMAAHDIETNRLETYRQSYHGVAQGLGELNAANCVSCHGYHDIQPPSDPRSKVNPANMIKTCGECHSNATENFVSGKIHVDTHSKSAGFVYYLRLVLIWVVGALIVVTIFWFTIDFRRKLKERRNRE